MCVYTTLQTIHTLDEDAQKREQKINNTDVLHCMLKNGKLCKFVLIALRKKILLKISNLFTKWFESQWKTSALTGYLLKLFLDSVALGTILWPLMASCFTGA